MILDLLARLLGGPRHEPAPARQRISAEVDPEVVYAIGDVHGCLTLLLALERQIVADAATRDGEKWIVLLGDFVDRGPQSAQLLDHLLKPPPSGFRRICLAGNHETMMAGFLAAPKPTSPWLAFGGRETLLSYGIPDDALQTPSQRKCEQLVASYIPLEHRDFLAQLPVMLETPRLVFVHAGLVPGRPITAQVERDLLWFNDDFAASYEGLGKIVVHGHVTRTGPLDSPWRIAVDTGAYHSGTLTAVRLDAGPPAFLSARRATASPS